MKNLLIRLLKDEEGASAIEYALIAALIAVAIIGGATALGGEAGDVFQSIANSLGGAGGGT